MAENNPWQRGKVGETKQHVLGEGEKSWGDTGEVALQKEIWNDRMCLCLDGPIGDSGGEAASRIIV